MLICYYVFNLFFCLKHGELWVVSLLDGHALHLDEPSWTADGGVDDDIGLAGKALLVEAAH